MEAKIIIEQSDNGISLKWQGNEFFAAGQNIVVLEYYTEKELGKMIWEDVDFTMNKETCPTYEQACELRREVSKYINDRPAPQPKRPEIIEPSLFGIDVHITPKEIVICECIEFLKKVKRIYGD